MSAMTGNGRPARALGGAAIALAVLVAAPLALSQWVIFLTTIALAKAMVVLGVVLLLRGGLISFGHGLYFAAGGYAVGFAMRFFEIREFVVLVALAGAAGLGLAAVLGLLLRRYRGIFFAMLSLALSMILYTLLLKFYSLTGGTDGMGIHAFTMFGVRPAAENLRLVQYYAVLAVSLGVLYLGAHFAASPLGYFMRALRYNEIRIEYVGASVGQPIYFSYLFSGALGGLGGGLVALNVGQISPELAYWTTSADFVFVAVFGGAQSIFAPFVGSIVFEFVKNYALKFSPQTWQMTLGTVLLLIIFFLPGGLWSFRDTLGRLVGRWRRS